MIPLAVKNVARYLFCRPVKRKAKREWSIAIYLGNTPTAFKSSPTIPNPVLTSQSFARVKAALVADPFMIRRRGNWYMFMEVVSGYTGRGEIGVAESKDGYSWRKCRIVLTEPFHLSYPYVFECGSEFYMIPESRQANSVRLYKATRFPTKWELVRELMSNCQFVDSSIFFTNGYWWLLTAGGKSPNAADTLFLYYSADLMGSWAHHPKSPVIISDPSRARPAGRIVKHRGEIYRYAQDCVPDYGMRVRAFKITHLTTSDYAEEEVLPSPILCGSNSGWNADGMHHIDPHVLDDGTVMACVDGWFWHNHRS